MADVQARLPLSFIRSKTFVGFRNRLPYRPPPVAPLIVASKLINISDIDFFIGGSALYTLASGQLDRSKYTVQKWRNMIMIQCTSDYIIHLLNRNFQFERLLSGRNMGKLDGDKTHVEHLQVLRIGKFKVLVAAGASGVDALDDRGRMVEFKAASKPNWKKTMLRMISSGSGRLMLGNTTLYGKLTGIEQYSLQQVYSMVPQDDRRALADNITSSLNSIRQLVGEQKNPFELGKWSKKGSPTLLPLDRNSSLLPDVRLVRSCSRTAPSSAATTGRRRWLMLTDCF